MLHTVLVMVMKVKVMDGWTICCIMFSRLVKVKVRTEVRVKVKKSESEKSEEETTKM